MPALYLSQRLSARYGFVSRPSVIIWRVSFQVAGHQTEGYQISTELYQGPLDLLLQLIERTELDITVLALAQVTDQYLAYLHNLENQDPAEVSAFLVIASRLVQIKSAALLPRPPAIERTLEEDPAEALARQLIQYRRFKQLSGFLVERENQGYHTYLRVAPPNIKVEPRLDLSSLTLADLVRTARQILFLRGNTTELSRVVSLPRVTIREKIQVIIDTLRHSSKTTFRSLLRTRSRIEIVVSFLAMLELVKRRLIQAEQIGLFTDIEIESLGNWDESIDADSEFGE